MTSYTASQRASSSPSSSFSNHRVHDVLPKRIGSNLAIALRCPTADPNLITVLKVLAKEIIAGTFAGEKSSAGRDTPSESDLIAYVLEHRISR
mmetsp:Transcript_81903/g.163580  ORF Transcript_81903/g.163580 Transcript_81903/m.163580 type:complete len:93 (+) Transcript_81903:393-671(+)